MVYLIKIGDEKIKQTPNFESIETLRQYLKYRGRLIIEQWGWDEETVNTWVEQLIEQEHSTIGSDLEPDFVIPLMYGEEDGFDEI